MRLSLALLFALGLQAAGPDCVAILRQSVAAEQANRAKARNFSYQEHQVQRELDARGNEKDRVTKTWDVIPLEGSTYRKLVLKNDRPLPEKEQKKEDERLRKETARRRAESAEERRKRLFNLSYSFRIPYPRMADIYDLKCVREDMQDGHGVYVIEGVPKPDFVPGTPDEKEALNFRTAVWIEKQELVPIRFDLEVIGDHSRMKKGSVASIVRSKIDDAWLTRETKIGFAMSVFKLIAVRGETTATFSNFKKFQVDSALIVQ